MKTLVTGGAGFIGSNVVRQLLQQGNTQVRVLHLKNEPLLNLKGLDVELVEGDITDRQSLKKAVEGCRQVFHLAAIYALWLPKPQLMWEVNVAGTRNLLCAAMQAGVEKVVHTSSIAAFGGQGSRLATESSPFALRPTGDYYSLTKYESQQVALEFARKGMDVCVVNPCAPIGPGDVGPTPTGRFFLSVMNHPVVAALPSLPSLVGDVRDVAKGHLLAMQHGQSGRCYILGAENATHDQLAKMALEIAGIKKPTVKLPYAAVQLTARCWKAYANLISKKAPLITPEALHIARLGLQADCSRARNELGYDSRPLESSIRDAVIWFAKNGYICNERITKKFTAS